MIKQWLTPGTIRLGRSKTAQYGEAQIIESVIEEMETPDKPTGKVTMLLKSDTIIYNDKGYASLSISDIDKELKVKVISAKIGHDRVDGILNVWHTRKPSENVFSAGSVFELNSLPTDWQALELNGIGERRQEGFGRIKFNYATLNSYVYQTETKSLEISKPSNPPQLIKEICTTIALQYLKKQVQLKAYSLAEVLPKQASKSLLATLEGFVRTGNFVAELSNLKRKSSQLLEKIESSTAWPDEGNYNLNNYLKDINKHMDKLIEDIELKSEFMPLAKVSQMQINQYSGLLLKEYLLTLFSAMRKKIKQKDLSGGGEDE